MYTLYTDKQELFECSISLEGASIKNSQARLIVESDNLNLLFKGTIDSNGKCSVPIKKLKNLLEESTKGKIRLEVIADDTYFTPWESDFEVETARKVTVEVKSQTNKTTIAETKTGVTVKNIKVGDHIQNLSKMLVKENINIQNMAKKKTQLNGIIASYLKTNKISDGEKGRIIEGIIQTLI
jgi:TusA-related sulfurtransferase